MQVKKTRFMKNRVSVTFLLLTVFFSVFLILANLLEVKIVDLGFMTVTGGLIVFPMSYIINDCIVEVYGFRAARFTIWLGFFMNLLCVALIQVAMALPADASWGGQDAFVATFGNSARILFASFTAMVCGSMVNAYVMSKMKIGQGGRHFSLRAVASTVFGETVDSLVFFPIAFWGILPTSTIVALVLTQAGLKTLYEIIALPVTIRVVRVLKRREELDVYDYNVSYRWWRIFDF